MERPQTFVDSPAKLEACAAAIERSERIGLDTESNGFHAYYEKVCLLQIATPDADWAVDPLALPLAEGPLLPLLKDPAREVILHAAEYDVLCMKRDYGLVFGRIFDTHAAAKTLGIEKVGLHNLLADQLGVQLSIDEQRSDWGRRPLTPQQLEYAFADVQFLLAMRDKLGAELERRGLLSEAQAEFARLVSKEPRPREFDPEGWQKMKPARTLDGRGRGVLRELYLLRDRRAREVNRPPFKVLSDLFLAEVARRLPKTEEELAHVPGTSPQALKKVGPSVLEAVRKGLASEPLARPRPSGEGQRWRKGGPGAPPPEVEERYERLRGWRKGRAEARKVEVQVIAPNAVLWAIARGDPQDRASLAGVEGMDAFRLEQYGDDILGVLEGVRSSERKENGEGEGRVHQGELNFGPKP
ncbi:MAG: ribonuclease D [Myxococcales bacterium]